MGYKALCARQKVQCVDLLGETKNSAWQVRVGGCPRGGGSRRAGKSQVRPQQVRARQRIPWRPVHASLCHGAAMQLLLAGGVIGCHGKVRPTGSARWHSCDGVGSLLPHARDVVSTSHCGISWTCRSSRSPALQGSKARVRPRGTAGCPSALVSGCPQGNLGRAPAGGGLAESGAVAEGFTSCSECWYGFGALLWDRAGDPGPRDPVPPVPWGCRCLHRTRSGGLTTLPPPGRFAKPPRTLGVWFPRGQWGGFAPLCPAPAAGNDELEIVVPHGARLVSREVSGTRVWHQVLTCRAPIFYFFSGGSPQLNMAHRCVSGSWARDVDPCCSCPRDLLPWICSSGPRPCPPPRGASCPGGRHFFRKAWL